MGGSHGGMCQDGDFDVQTWIKCGLRSFGLTFRTSRFARQVPQLAALALHTAGFTAQASQFAQSWFGLHYFTCNTIFIWLDLFNFKAKLFIFSSIVLVMNIISFEMRGWFLTWMTIFLLFLLLCFIFCRLSNENTDRTSSLAAFSLVNLFGT